MAKANEKTDGQFGSVKSQYLISNYFLITSPPGQKITKTDREVLKVYKQSAYDWCEGRERAPETGQFHIHLYLCFNGARAIDIRDLPGWHIEPVNAENILTVLDYCKKDGNYKHKREVLPKPYENNNPVWRPWQQRVLNAVNEPRRIVVVVDIYGNSGKTYLAMWHAVRHKAHIIPVLKDYRDFMRATYELMSNCNCQMLFVDIPRALGSRAERNLYGAIESIKDGYAYDERYEFNYRYFDPPKIVVFTNKEPDKNLLSLDRWNIIRLDPYENSQTEISIFS